MKDDHIFHVVMVQHIYDFAYYFINYPTFVGAHHSKGHPCCYFSINGNRDELDLLSLKYCAKPTSTYHADPIIYSIKQRLLSEYGDRKIYLSCYDTGSERVPLYLYENIDNESKLVGTLEHITGIHGDGGFRYIDENGIIQINDDVNIDRVMAGVEFLQKKFPDTCFCNR